MRFSMWTSYFVEMSPDEMVQQFAEKGWFELELSDEHGKALLDRGKPASVGREFKSFAQEHGITFPQGHLWLTCDIAAQAQRDTLDLLKKWIDLYQAIGIKSAVLHPGGKEMLQMGCLPLEIHERRILALNELTHYIKGTDMTICLENIVSTAPDIDDLLKIIEDADGNKLGICLDTGHLNLTSKKPKEFILKADNYLKAIHIADNDGSGDQHLMPYGRGDVHWGDVIAGLKAINYDRPINLEIPGEIRCPLSVKLAKLDYLKVMLRHMWESK